MIVRMYVRAKRGESKMRCINARREQTAEKVRCARGRRGGHRVIAYIGEEPNDIKPQETEKMTWIMRSDQLIGSEMIAGTPPLLLLLLLRVTFESRLCAWSLTCISSLMRCLRMSSSLSLNELASSIRESGEEEIKKRGGCMRMLNASASRWIPSSVRWQHVMMASPTRRRNTVPASRQVST